MNVEKRYWKWNEIFNHTDYKLRGEIDSLISKGLVQKCAEPNEFSGINNIPWNIRVSDGKITHIFYNQKFEALLNTDVWVLELKDFEERINRTFQPSSENEECDKLIVIFREFFVAVAGIVAFRRK